MKIEQEPKFQPITITLESKRDVEMFRQVTRAYQAKGPDDYAFCKQLSDWFNNQAQL